MVIELLWNAAWAYRCCLETSTATLSGGNKSTAAVFRNSYLLLLRLLHTVLPAWDFLIQNTLNQCPYLPPSRYLNKALFLHNLHPSEVKRQSWNHCLFLIAAPLFSNIIFHSTCRLSFSQGKITLQSKNTGVACSIYLPLHPSASPQHFWYQLPMIWPYWAYETKGWMNCKYWKSRFHLFCSLTW